MAPSKKMPAKQTKKQDALNKEAFKLIAKLEKAKAEIARGKAEEAMLVGEHESKKAAYAREAERMDKQKEAHREEHKNKMKKLREETAKAKKKLDHVRFQPVEDNVELKLEKEKTNMSQQKGRMIAAERKLIEEDVRKNGGEPLDWQRCQICTEPFDQDRKPKVLKCSHTFCSHCCKRFHKNVAISCPIDRITTTVRLRAIDSLPENLALSDLCL
ncbi:hypothetical protein CAEBREN_14484 [Caenorhabditis brenneri]|uniref:RING-type domain-containing protein n=1 Tax=Caenorhabditis brenneri TaxID=135651 RepID=G0P3T1_CAEBE|nr:hypothetical protein CAEBREN_14484 [Caenorhabditis brenneri]